MSGEQTHETFLSLTCKFHLEPKPTMKITSTHIFPKNAKLPNSFIRNGKSSCSLARATKRRESINHHQQTPKQTHTKITKWIEIFGENKQIHSLVLFLLFLLLCVNVEFSTELFLPPKPTTTPAPYVFTTAKPRRKHNHGKNHHESGNKAKGENGHGGQNQLQRGEFDPNLALNNEGELHSQHESCREKAKLWRAMNYYDFCHLRKLSSSPPPNSMKLSTFSSSWRLLCDDNKFN